MLPRLFSKFKAPSYRALVGFLFVAGVVALGEAGILAKVYLIDHVGKKTFPAAALSQTKVPVSPTPAVKALEDDIVAAAKEKSLVSTIPQQTPTPAPTPASVKITPESRVAELINLARQLREKGDTGTAMSRLREAQTIFSRYPPIISEMAITYEKMGLTDKAIEQWRRIYEIGEAAGIYYAAAEAKLRALQVPDSVPEDRPNTGQAVNGGLLPNAARGQVLSLGNVGTVDDTGNTQPLRHLKLRVPICAVSGAQIEPRDVVIQVFFYEKLKDGSVVETNANVTSSWARRLDASGYPQPVDWSTPEPEVLEVNYAQPDFDPKDPKTREQRNYFGYCVRVYYKGVLEAKFADPTKLLGQFIPPAALPSSDLPR